MMRSFAGLAAFADFPERADGCLDGDFFGEAFLADDWDLGGRFIGQSITDRRKRTSPSGLRPNRTASARVATREPMTTFLLDQAPPMNVFARQWMLFRALTVAVAFTVTTVPRAASAQPPEIEAPPSNPTVDQPPMDEPPMEEPPMDEPPTDEQEMIVGASGMFKYPADADPELVKEVESRYAKFKMLGVELQDAVLDQRKHYLLYANFEDRTPKAERAYFDARAKARDLFNQTFTAALELLRITPEQESATFLATWAENRLRNDIYDLETSEAASRLIDGGSTLLVLFKAAARSGVASGKFDLARKVLEAMEEEQMDEVDKSLLYFLDKHEEAYLAEMKIREAEAARDDQPRVKLETTQGDVVLELYLDSAPNAVSHFIGLVEQGFYDGLDFHQVIDNLLALTGDPTGLGSGNSGKFLIDEHERPDARKALRGSLLMAKIPDGDKGNFVPNSASSQFAILFLPVATAVDQQTVFGRVIEGIENVCRMQRIDPSKEKKKDEIVIPADRILSATVIRRPDELPTPQYLNLGRGN